MPDVAKALEDGIEAMNVWLHQYAPEHCGEEYVKESQKIIADNHGTIAYITARRISMEESLVAVKKANADFETLVREEKEKGTPLPGT